MSPRARDQLTLFSTDAPVPERVTRVGAASPSDEVRRLATSLSPLIRLGTSSWSFPGWAGLVYDREADRRTLAREGLSAYVRHPLFGAVGVDRTYYAPLPARHLRELAAVAPADFRFVVKAAERCTVEVFPRHARYGAWRGRPNPHFLDPTWTAEQVVAPVVDGLGAHGGPVVFQFPPAHVDDVSAFIDRLHAFLRALPVGPLYAVEVRSRVLCTQALAAALADVGVAPCLTVHPSMPSLRAQATTLHTALAGPTVIRWMLGHGRDYEAARERYAPFDRLVDADQTSRRSVAELALRAVRRRQPAFVTVNNKAEGSAPRSIVALAQEIAAQDAAAER